jgi:glycosyltransferase involved in cell wall biosynthesis
MGTPSSSATAPIVSVIVPARNEEACLGACLDSLAGQTGVSFEIIVVDDHSTDRTRAIATSYPDIKVIIPGPVPPGWTGKNNAVTAGARIARAEWLLFTDADTVHAPGSLARALNEARTRDVALLSYSPEQEVETFAEKIVMPVIFAELASTFRPAEVSDPRSPAAAANGQYILIQRSTYESTGGHAAVATDLLEDVALARRLKQSGHAIFFRLGTGLVRTRMYRTFAQLREGWTKNLVLLFPRPVTLALIRFLEFALLFASPVFLAVAIVKGKSPLWISLAALAVALAWATFLRRIARAHFSWKLNFLASLGLPLFSYLLMRSWLAHRRGNVSWKGRSYAGRRPESASGPHISHLNAGQN